VKILGIGEIGGHGQTTCADELIGSGSNPWTHHLGGYSQNIKMDPS